MQLLQLIYNMLIYKYNIHQCFKGKNNLFAEVICIVLTWFFFFFFSSNETLPGKKMNFFFFLKDDERLKGNFHCGL